jgi:hypothetical protein
MAETKSFMAVVVIWYVALIHHLYLAWVTEYHPPGSQIFDILWRQHRAEEAWYHAKPAPDVLEPQISLS